MLMSSSLYKCAKYIEGDLASCLDIGHTLGVSPIFSCIIYIRVITYRYQEHIIKSPEKIAIDSFAGFLADTIQNYYVRLVVFPMHFCCCHIPSALLCKICLLSDAFLFL